MIRNYRRVAPYLSGKEKEKQKTKNRAAAAASHYCWNTLKFYVRMDSRGGIWQILWLQCAFALLDSREIKQNDLITPSKGWGRNNWKSTLIFLFFFSARGCLLDLCVSRFPLCHSEEDKWDPLMGGFTIIYPSPLSGWEQSISHLSMIHEIDGAPVRDPKRLGPILTSNLYTSYWWNNRSST